MTRNPNGTTANMIPESLAARIKDMMILAIRLPKLQMM